MKKQIVLLVVVATFACCSVSQAMLTGAQWLPSSCTNLTCNSQDFDGDAVSMTGTQLSMNAARIVGTYTTDSPGDPTLFLGSSVDNDTGYVWDSYQVNVIMSVPFTFFGIPTVSTVPPDAWFLASTTAPTLQSSGPYTGKYEGTMIFSAGAPLGIGDVLFFNYAINFASSTDYAFTQEMIPMYSQIPEPGMLALAGLGGLALAFRLRRNSRTGA